MSELDRIINEIYSTTPAAAAQAAPTDEIRKKLAELQEGLYQKSPEEKPDDNALPKVEGYLQQHDGVLTGLTELTRDPSTEVRLTDGLSLVVDMLTSASSTTSFIRPLLGSAEQWKADHADAFEPESALMMLKRVAGTALTAVQGLTMIPLMTRRVLGLYDVMLLASGGQSAKLPTLAIVEPNVRRIAGEMTVLYDDLLLSVVLHEDIHNRQFASYEQELDGKRSTLGKEITLLNILKTGWAPLKGVSQGEIDQRYDRVKDELQTLMSVVEGHADFYTEQALKDIMGEKAHHYFSTLKEVRRNLAQSGALRAFLEITKSPMLEKMEQYDVGSMFVGAVDEVLGKKASAFIFEHLPEGMDEVREPARYLARNGLSAEN